MECKARKVRFGTSSMVKLPNQVSGFQLLIGKRLSGRQLSASCLQSRIYSSFR